MLNLIATISIFDVSPFLICDARSPIHKFKFRNGFKLSYYTTQQDSIDVPTLDAYDFGPPTPPFYLNNAILPPSPLSNTPMTSPNSNPYVTSWISSPPSPNPYGTPSNPNPLSPNPLSLNPSLSPSPSPSPNPYRIPSNPNPLSPNSSPNPSPTPSPYGTSWNSNQPSPSPSPFGTSWISNQQSPRSSPSPSGTSWILNPPTDPPSHSDPGAVRPHHGSTQTTHPPSPMGPTRGPDHRWSPDYAVWCIAKPTVPEPVLQRAMDYACGNGADCGPFKPNGPCFGPNTLVSHASYAFNSYWQRTKIVGGTCDFGGVAMLVTVDPGYRGCHFNYT